MARQDKPRYANALNQAAEFARELDGLTVSVDVSTGDGPDWGDRVFGRIYGAQADEERNASVTLLAEAIEDNRSPDPLRELAEWLVAQEWQLPALRGRTDAAAKQLTEAITRARRALGRED